jgi:hypothetical protein
LEEDFLMYKWVGSVTIQVNEPNIGLSRLNVSIENVTPTLRTFLNDGPKYGHSVRLSVVGYPSAIECRREALRARKRLCSRCYAEEPTLLTGLRDGTVVRRCEDCSKLEDALYAAKETD